MAEAAIKHGGTSDARGGNARDAAFARAKRHSRIVRSLKIALPAVAVIVTAAFVGYSMLSSVGVANVQFGMPSVEDGNLVMSNPKLDGFTNDDLPYEMTAERAKQALGGGSDIHLEGIRAKVPMDKDTKASIEAASGIYNRERNTLDIDSALTLTTTSGINARLQSANVDVESNEISSQDPVEVDMKGTHIAADSLYTQKGGKVFVFRKRVRVSIEPGETRGQDADKGSANK